MCATKTKLQHRICKPLSLPKSRRILKSTEFREVYQSGVRMSCRYFAAFCLHRSDAPELPGRVGFTVPRALGSAVVRNRIKRRMREATRFYLTQLPPNYGLVFNPRRSVLEASFEDLCRETEKVIVRCSKQS
jgi:ribonuclease P protein component